MAAPTEQDSYPTVDCRCLQILHMTTIMVRAVFSQAACPLSTLELQLSSLAVKDPGLQSAPPQTERWDSTALKHDISTLTVTIYYSLKFRNRKQNVTRPQNTAT